MTSEAGNANTGFELSLPLYFHTQVLELHSKRKRQLINRKMKSKILYIYFATDSAIVLLLVLLTIWSFKPTFGRFWEYRTGILIISHATKKMVCNVFASGIFIIQGFKQRECGEFQKILGPGYCVPLCSFRRIWKLFI